MSKGIKEEMDLRDNPFTRKVLNIGGDRETFLRDFPDYITREKELVEAAKSMNIELVKSRRDKYLKSIGESVMYSDEGSHNATDIRVLLMNLIDNLDIFIAGFDLANRDTEGLKRKALEKLEAEIAKQ